MLFLTVLCTGNVLMLLNGTWRQHKTLTSNMSHTGHTRALDTEHDSQVTHGELDHETLGIAHRPLGSWGSPWKLRAS